MPFLKEIVDYLNTGLTSGNLSQYKTNCVGITQTGHREGDSFPVIFSDKGNGEVDAFNDSKDLTIYHRCLDIQYTLENTTSQFGNGGANFIEIAVMKMIVLGKRDVVLLTQEQLAFKVISGFSTNPPRADFVLSGLVQSPVITITNVDKNSQSVYQNEFKLAGVEYPIKPNHLYFAINYKITTHYNSSCTDACSDC